MAAIATVEIVRIATGGHTCALGARGELYTFGNGKHGQLGHGEGRAESAPRRVMALRGVRVLGIACGDFHTLALADDGLVYTWGAGSFGELGHASLEHHAEPRVLEALRERTLVFAACGASHNVLLLLAGAPPGSHRLVPPYSGQLVHREALDDDDAASVTTVGRNDMYLYGGGVDMKA